MSNYEKLIQALSHMSILSIEGYARLCDLIINNSEVIDELIANYENNFKPFHNNSDYNDLTEVVDCLLNHNNLSEEAICFLLQLWDCDNPAILKHYCPHVVYNN